MRSVGDEAGRFRGGRVLDSGLRRCGLDCSSLAAVWLTARKRLTG